MTTLEDVQNKINGLKSLKYYEIEDFVKFDGDADKLTAELKSDDIKTSQLRKFFAAVKEIEMYVKEKGDWDEKAKMDFYLLMPKLAYAKGRKVISEDFFNLMKISMEKVGSGDKKDTLDDFLRFVQFLEAIVAFFKVHNQSQY